MSLWFERQIEIRGLLNIKLSFTAMAVLLSSQHPALQTIQASCPPFLLHQFYSARLL
jgi:hypothetical protein